FKDRKIIKKESEKGVVSLFLNIGKHFFFSFRYLISLNYFPGLICPSSLVLGSRPSFSSFFFFSSSVHLDKRLKLKAKTETHIATPSAGRTAAPIRNSCVICRIVPTSPAINSEGAPGRAAGIGMA